MNFNALQNKCILNGKINKTPFSYKHRLLFKLFAVVYKKKSSLNTLFRFQLHEKHFILPRGLSTVSSYLNATYDIPCDLFLLVRNTLLFKSSPFLQFFWVFKGLSHNKFVSFNDVLDILSHVGREFIYYFKSIHDFINIL